MADEEMDFEPPVAAEPSTLMTVALGFSLLFVVVSIIIAYMEYSQYQPKP